MRRWLGVALMSVGVLAVWYVIVRIPPYPAVQYWRILAVLGLGFGSLLLAKKPSQRP